MRFGGRSPSVRILRRSFHTEEATIDVEDDFSGRGDIRLVERGRGYVKVLVLYEEELQWLKRMCWKEENTADGFRQLGSLRGGRRTLICTRIKEGATRKLELRLFAPFGRRQLCIPELVAGQGWMFLVDILSIFVRRGKPGKPAAKRNGEPMLEKNFHSNERRRGHTVKAQSKRSYLQVASLSQWHLPELRSHFTEGEGKEVIVNYDDAVESSFEMARCLVGNFGASLKDHEDMIALKGWTESRWKVPGGVEIKEMDQESYLFIFPSRELAEEQIGNHMFRGMPLILDRWNSWSCCNRQDGGQVSTWIRVIGLPPFLWVNGLFKNIGDLCGGFMETANETRVKDHLKWAKLKVKGNGRRVPASVRIKVGSAVYDCPIWVDRRPWVD